MSYHWDENAEFIPESNITTAVLALFITGLDNKFALQPSWLLHIRNTRVDSWEILQNIRNEQKNWSKEWAVSYALWCYRHIINRAWKKEVIFISWIILYIYMWIRHSLAFKYFLTFKTLPYFYEILTQFHRKSFYILNLENYFNHFYIFCQLWANCQGFRGLLFFKHTNVHIYKEFKPCFGPEQSICCYIFQRQLSNPLEQMVWNF